MSGFVEDAAEMLGNMPVLQAQDFEPPEGVDSKAKQWLCIFGLSGFTDGCSGKVARIAAEFACSLCVRDVAKPREKFVYLKPGVTWPLERIAAGRPFSSTADGEACVGNLLASTWQGTAVEHMDTPVHVDHFFTDDGWLYHAACNWDGLWLCNGNGTEEMGASWRYKGEKEVELWLGLEDLAALEDRIKHPLPSFAEGQVCELPRGAQIHHAAYQSANGPGTADVTAIVRKLYEEKGNFLVDNINMQGDPVPGKVKELVVRYTVDEVASGSLGGENVHSEKADTPTTNFESLQPLLIYRPHSWVTIRAQVEWGFMSESNPDIEGFLRLIEASTQADTDGINAVFTPGMVKAMADQMWFLTDGLAVHEGENQFVLDRKTASILPDVEWRSRYVVNATRDGVKGMISLRGGFNGGILYGLTEGLVFTPGESVDAQDGYVGGETKYLVIAPRFRSMETDGVPRCAFHEVTIECEEKIDIPGLEHFVAALVPKKAIPKTQIVHKYLRLSTQLISQEWHSVPAGWRRTPLVHKQGEWTAAPVANALDAMRPTYDTEQEANRFDAVSKVACEHGFPPRGKDEKDWHYSRRAQQFLNSRVRYDANSAPGANDAHGPAMCLTSRVAHCGHYAMCYRELLSMGGVLCRVSLGEISSTRGMCHCVNDVFLEGCGWIPVEPEGDPSAIYGSDHSEWGTPSFIQHPQFGVCDDMIITDHLIDYNEHRNDIRILLGSGDGDDNDPAELTKRIESLFTRFDANKNGVLDMEEARNMMSTLLNVNVHWSGADTALNEVVHALDLNGDGSVSKEELLTAVANNHGGVAHLLLSASKQMKMGQSVAQVRPVIGGKVVDGVLKGVVGDSLVSLGHGFAATCEMCNYTQGFDTIKSLQSTEHIIFSETNGKGEKCAVQQPVSDEEANELFEKIEARCKAAFAENCGSTKASQ